MTKMQIPLDCGMPEYRAHLAGPAALVVEFGSKSDRTFRKWDLALGLRPTEVFHHNIASITEAAQ
jgi:hypothetical protein